MIRLGVEFDRADRCYKFGDEVTGSVSVETNSGVNMSEVWISHGWGTHGRGFPDGCHERRILKAGNIPLRAGECKTFPFHFCLPNGPVTYHGHYVNVDWYVTAHARTSSGRDYKEEQDFLLLGGEPTGTILLGDMDLNPDDIPIPSTAGMPASTSTLQMQPANLTMLWIVSAAKSIFSVVFFVVMIGLTLIALSALSTSASAGGLIIASVVVASALIWYGVPKTIRSLSHSKLDLNEFCVDPDVVRRGSRVHCHLAFRTKARIHTRDIKITIFAQERVTRPAGTTITTDYYIVDERTFVRSIDEELPASRAVAFDYALPVDEETPPTFSSKNNGLDWYIKVQVGLKGWPAMIETVPLTIVP